VEHVPGRDLLGVATPVVLPNALVEAVVEVVELHVLELGPGGAEQLLTDPDVAIH
jgi:hypothetical protein